MSLLSLQAIPKVFAIVHFKSHQFSARLEHVQKNQSNRTFTLFEKKKKLLSFHQLKRMNFYFISL